MESLLWNHDILKPIGEKIVKLLLDMSFDSHPFIIHVFSNGGAYLYHHIQLAIKQSNSVLDVRGIIMDSAPCDRRLMNIYRATSAIYAKEQRNNCVISWFIALAILATWILEVTIFNLTMWNKFRANCSSFFEKGLFHRAMSVIKSLPYEELNLYKQLKYENTSCPQLILYSKQDKLVSYKVL